VTPLDNYLAYAARRGMGTRFDSHSVAALYRHRAPYSDEVFSVLRELLGDRTPVVLDAGCGPGTLARTIALDVERVDAVDVSSAMLETGRSQPGGDHPAIQWICGPIEDAPLHPPYGLAVAGASFHWFAAERVLTRLAEILEPGAFLVLLNGDAPWKPPWADAERDVMIEFMTRMNGRRPDWQSPDLERRRLLDVPDFVFKGRRLTEAVPYSQNVADYVACQHSRATFTPEAMGLELALEFDEALAAALAPYVRDEVLEYDRRTLLEWGHARSRV
jgi:SAM-dependent methyltransferase